MPIGNKTAAGGATIIVQAFGGFVDWVVQNFLIYGVGILILGQFIGYACAACVGGFFNVMICFILKLYVYGSNGDMTKTVRAYTKLRLWLAFWGSLITYLPLFFGIEFFLSSAVSWVFSTVILVWKSPKIFGKAV